MDRFAADSFVYSKACGMYARSFVGKRTRLLFEARRLRDLWTILFDDEVPLAPEGLLTLYLERRAEQQAVDQFITLLSAYDKPDLLSKTLVSFYDYNNLKSAVSAVLTGESEPPFMVDLKQFSILDRTKWPDIAAMTRNSPFSWYDHVPEGEEQIAWEVRLDNQYYCSLLEAARTLPAKDRRSAEPMILEEVILQNIIWTMRLVSYYSMKSDQIIPMLAGNDEPDAVRDIVCGPAISVLNRSFDTYSDWKGWKYEWLLNPHEEGFPWSLDPRWAQLAADKYLFNNAMKHFHKKPFTAGVLVSFLKIKQLEDQMIRVAAEGLRLGASDTQIMEYVGDIFHA